MGQAHSRGCRRAPSYFPDRNYEPELVVVSDTVAVRGEEAVRSFGFASAVADWRQVVEHDDVDVVFVTAPNMLHVEMVEAAAANGKHVFCEKPVGGTPVQTVAAERATRRAGVISGVGYNYRWAPLVQYAKQLVDSGEIGEITNYYGRFFSMYGSDPLGVLSWRFLVDQAGHGVSTDILSHSVDLAHFLIGGVAGPITRVVGNRRDLHQAAAGANRGRHALRPRERWTIRLPRSPTRTTSARCASSRVVPEARSRRVARWSGPRARTCSRSTALGVRSGGTSSR